MTKDKNKEKIETLEELANKLLSLMGTKAKAEVKEDKENQTFIVEIDAGEETGLLIGRRGETLNSIQSVLGMMLRQKFEEWSRVVVNVGDWREKQEDYLKGIAEQAATKAKETGEPQAIYNLSPAERRIIHLTLSEDPGVETESTGEEAERYLVVKPKKK